MLLWFVMAGGVLILGGQMTKLAVVQGAERFAAAERRLDLVDYLPTTRGRILDRHGRPVAIDRPSYDVAVDYEVINGAWPLQQAARDARAGHQADWAEMSPDDREAAVAQRLPAYEKRVEALWAAIVEHGGIERAELDRRLDAIKKDVQSMAAVVWERQLRQDIKFAGDGEQEFRPRPIREQRQAHVVLPRVPDRVAFAFRRMGEDRPGRAPLPGVSVLDSHRRAYPWDTVEVTLDRSHLPRPLRTTEPITIRVEGVADHLLGTMRGDVWAADIERRPFRNDDRPDGIDLAGYREGDAVGHRGLERAFERHLRGARGVMLRRLDSGELQRTPPTPGRDLSITLDIALQARIQAVMSPQFGLMTAQQWQAGYTTAGALETVLPLGTPLDGAAVVLDVDSGDILAMVSVPTIAAGLAAPCPDEHKPYCNRPVEEVYPPGSIAKPIVLAAAVSEQVHGLAAAVDCQGHYLPDRVDVARCWCYRAPHFTTHGPLRAEEALARSCNIYFYTLGAELGMARIADWYGRFGVGRPLDVGLMYEARRADGSIVWRGESGGTVPAASEIEQLRKAGELRFATVIMGIGQGPVMWTPVQAANAYATIARRGATRPPTLVRDRPRRSEAPPAAIELDDVLVAAILDGLRASVSEMYGTGHHIAYADGTVEPIINVPDVTVWAKTGTAQARQTSRDLDCDGEADVTLDDPTHAWFVGLVGGGAADAARPRYAIAVVVEYGGSGGRTAGPVANEIIRALRSEGYLETQP